MNKLLGLFSLVACCVVLGCGPSAAPPATAEEQEAIQAPIDDYAEQMQNMNSSGQTQAPDFSGGN